jgi:uncharacterized protein (DUF2147 family)
MFRRIHFPAQACCAALVGMALAVSSAPPARTATTQLADAAPADGVFGTWSTQDDQGVIAIERCGDALCGRIVGIVRAPGEPVPRDVHGASECGLTIIAKEKPTGDGAWLGEVTDPRTGTTYRAKIWVDAGGNLRLRGFLIVPLLGQTQTWHHYNGHLTAACELA